MRFFIFQASIHLLALYIAVGWAGCTGATVHKSDRNAIFAEHKLEQNNRKRPPELVVDSPDQPMPLVIRDVLFQKLKRKWARPVEDLKIQATPENQRSEVLELLKVVKSKQDAIQTKYASTEAGANLEQGETLTWEIRVLFRTVRGSLVESVHAKFAFCDDSASQTYIDNVIGQRPYNRYLTYHPSQSRRIVRIADMSAAPLDMLAAIIDEYVPDGRAFDAEIIYMTGKFDDQEGYFRFSSSALWHASL